MIIAEPLSLLSLLTWGYLLVGRGGFWLARERDSGSGAVFPPPESPTAGPWPAVVAVVPARDEAAFVGRSIGSLLAQDYPGPLRIVLVDDQSRDGTADAARTAVQDLEAADRLEIISGSPLPQGWTGKLWALQQGVDRGGAGAEYLLLTDADIVHAPDNLRRLVARAERGGLVGASLMARLRCESLAERMLIPAFVFFFAMVFPFAWVNRPNNATAAAAGGCVLVRRVSLEAAGGIASIREAIIDDCALAQRLKTQGPIWLGLSDRVTSLRPYDRWNDIRRMVVRSAYAQLRYSPLLLLGNILALVLIFWAPPLFALAGGPGARLGATAAWAAMALLLQPMLRFYRVSPLWGLAFPAIASAYVAFTVESAVRYWRGEGGLWKGRIQALR